MAKDWNFSSGTAGFERWWRSPQQLIMCPPGGVPTLDAPITIITKYENGDVVTQEAPAVNIRMDQLSFPRDIEDALVIQAAVYRILARRVDPMALPPEERLPETTPTPAPLL